MAKSADAFRSIGEVARLIGVAPHVLRYWETQFPQLSPVKRADGRRYYRPDDVRLAAGLCEVMRDDGMTARGAARLMAEDKGAALRARGAERLRLLLAGETEVVRAAPVAARARRGAKAAPDMPLFAKDETGEDNSAPDDAAETGSAAAARHGSPAEARDADRSNVAVPSRGAAADAAEADLPEADRAEADPPANPAPLNPAPVNNAPANPALADTAPVNPASVNTPPANPALADTASVNPAAVRPSPPQPADPYRGRPHAASPMQPRLDALARRIAALPRGEHPQLRRLAVALRAAWSGSE